MEALNGKNLLSELNLNLKEFQDNFWHSLARFPAFIAGWGTGKTLFGILRGLDLSQEIPNNLGLIVRKEFTDLHDSTVKDFEKYTGLKINAEKDVVFPNGSVIMFRHGKELDVLKNVNLGWFFIEQAEEFDTEDQFEFLRGRLRRADIPFHTGFVIANANGHNWLWRMWVNNPQSEDYHLSCANTFDNADNLPADFIKDLKRMEKESPNHYKQYVLNSFEEVGADDLLLEHSIVYNSPMLVLTPGVSRRRILSVDVARFGEDETVFTIIEEKNLFQWEQILQEAFKDKDTIWTTGYAIDLERRFKTDMMTVDDVGVGGGVTDGLRSQHKKVFPFLGNEASRKPDMYENRKAEGYFILKDMFHRHWLKIIDDITLAEQLLSIKYKFKGNGKKAIISKDEMRKEGLKSPDRAEALMMAAFVAQTTTSTQSFSSLPRQAEMEPVET